MKKYNGAKLYNRHGFKPGKYNSPGEYEYAKAKYLLHFDFDPEAVTEGLALLRSSYCKGFKPAEVEIRKIKHNKIYEPALKMYRFIHGRDLL